MPRVGRRFVAKISQKQGRVGVKERRLLPLAALGAATDITNAPLPDAHAARAAARGGGRATSLASLRRFWAIAPTHGYAETREAAMGAFATKPKRPILQAALPYVLAVAVFLLTQGARESAKM
jgi:hypothetical protein